MNKKKSYFISLGTGHHQCPLIRSALSEGYSLIGIDQDMNSEGMPLCDIKIIESILDVERLHEKVSLITLGLSIKGGFSASHGEALSNWISLAEKLGLKGIRKKTAEYFLDKLRIREALKPLTKGKKKALFKQPKFTPICTRITASELEKSIGYPMIIKPKNGYMKKNISLIEDRRQLKTLITQSPSQKNAMRTMICEEYIPGMEITVVGLVEDSNFYLILLADKITSTCPPFIELEHIFPSKLFFMKEKIIDTHQSILETFQIECSPIVSEWKYFNGDLYLIEVSLQVPGEYLGSFLIPKLIDYDYFRNLVKLMTDNKIKKINWESTKKHKSGSIQYWQQRPSPNLWKQWEKRSDFSKILNRAANFPPKDNSDRYGVMGFVH